MTSTHTIFAIAAAAATAAAQPVESLDQAGLQEAFRELRSRYIRSGELTPLALNRAALAGVLDSLDFGATLTAPGAEPDGVSYTTRPLHAELPGGIFYLRPASLDAANLPAFESALASIPRETTHALVLDLRAPAPHGSFEAAAAYADRLLPVGLPLFSLQSPGGEPRTFRTLREPSLDASVSVQVLVDSDSSNVAETLAAVLREHRSAFLVGTPTPGRTVEYRTIPLGGDVSLRMATAEMLLHGGRSLFRTGLAPDLVVPADDVMKTAFFSSDVPPSEFIAEEQRPRFNEAALVHGTYPELPYLADRTAGRPSPIDRAPQVDPALQRAVELLTARAALSRQPE